MIEVKIWGGINLDEIIKNGTLSTKTLLEISRNYGIPDKKIKVQFEKTPINLNFTKNIKIKYSNLPNQDSVLSNILIISESIINAMRIENQEDKSQIDKLIKKYNDCLNEKTIIKKKKNSTKPN